MVLEKLRQSPEVFHFPIFSYFVICQDEFLRIELLRLLAF